MPAADRSPAVLNADLDRLFQRFAELDQWALAVSGGADSLALLVLAVRWRGGRDRGPKLTVLTVDHGLRPDAADEGRFVASVAERLGAAVKRLRWEGPYPRSNIEAAARSARYDLLAEAARALGIGTIATAHHREDQAETFLMRLARGSGAYGLSCMAPEVERDGMRIVRPLLGLPHETLVAVVEEAGLEAIADPHNRDERFSRARIRRLMPVLAEEGLDAATLAGTARRLRRTAEALECIVDRLLSQAAFADDFGAVRLDQPAWQAEPEEIRLRSLARILRAVGGADYVPRIESVERLAAAVSGDPDPMRRTLAGTVIDRRKGVFRFQREAGRGGLPDIEIADGVDTVWDGRFRVSVRVRAGTPVTLGALGADGRRALAVCVEGGMPRAIEALPAIRRGSQILGVPSLGIQPETQSGVVVETNCLVPGRMMHPAGGRDM